MATAKRPKQIVLLDESDAESLVQVRMKDGDQFFAVMTEAAKSLQAVDKLVEFRQQFSELIEDLRRWLDARRPRIKTAFVRVRERDILFLVMQKDVEFDAELSAELTELDIQVANSVHYSLLDLDVLLIPAVENASSVAFLSSGDRYRYAD